MPTVLKIVSYGLYGPTINAAVLSSIFVSSLAAVLSSKCVPREKLDAAGVFFSFSENDSPSLSNAKVPLHLETFSFGEKIRVSEKPSNPRAQISLDEWL